jgi:hypothetical protein
VPKLTGKLSMGILHHKRENDGEKKSGRIQLIRGPISEILSSRFGQVHHVHIPHPTRDL